MEIIIPYTESLSTSIILLSSNKNSTINVSRRDGSVVYHGGIDDNFNCFERSHWEPVNMFICSVGSEKEQNINIGDIVLGRCNNIETMRLEVMRVTDIMSKSKSVYCDGIWTDGSAMKMLASNVQQYVPNMGSVISFDNRDMGGDCKYHLLSEGDIKFYLDFINALK